MTKKNLVLKFFGVAAAVTLIAGITGCGGGADDEVSNLSPDCSAALQGTAEAYMQTVKNSLETGGTSAGEMALAGVVEQLDAACTSVERPQAVSVLLADLTEAIDVSPESPLTKNSAQLGVSFVCSKYEVATSQTFSRESKTLCVDSESRANGFLDEAKSSGETETGSEGVEIQLPKQVDSYEVRYVVSGSGAATVTYLDNNESRQEEVTLPWEYTKEMTSDYTSVFANGTNSGELSCAIFHGGAEAVTQSDTSDAPFVNCAAIKN